MRSPPRRGLARRHDHLRHVLEMLAQVVRQAAEADGGEEVDGEARVLGRVLGHDPLEAGLLKTPSLHRTGLEPFNVSLLQLMVRN